MTGSQGRASRRRKVLRILLPVMTMVWMCLIFRMSAQPADDSAELSLSVGEMIGRFLIPDFDSWPEEEQTAWASRIDHPVRKLAHGMEYMILGILLTLDARIYAREGRRMIQKHISDRPAKAGRKELLLSEAAIWMTGTLYACTDEWHQLYVPGRSCQFRDILIDSGGVLAGMLLTGLTAEIRRHGSGPESRGKMSVDKKQP